MSFRIEQDRRLRRITLAAPEKRNVFDAGRAAEFLRELREANDDPGTGAILIEADGPVFCAGLDPASPPPEEFFTFGRRMTKPVVAAVKGAAVSGGLVPIANAHVAIAAQGSSFGLIEIREGRWNANVYQAVASAIGERRALELTLTGRIFSAQEALSWGLIHSVAPVFEIDDRGMDTATALANANVDAVAAVLRARTEALAR